MTRERSSSARCARCVLCCFVVLAALASSGCRFLADEFTWLDRTPPGAGKAPDAPVSGGDGRP